MLVVPTGNGAVLLKSDAFMWNKELECIPRKELERLQVERLRQTISRLAQHVPRYRALWDELTLDADSIKSVADLEQFPFTTKSDLRDHYPVGLVAVAESDIKRIHASSGTRGKPTIAPYTQADLDLWSDLCARALATAGVRPGDRVQNSYGYGLFTGGLGLHYGAERLGATVIPASSGRTQQQIMLLQDFAPRALCCTPSYALNIATTLGDMAVKKETLGLEIGILGAEPWTEACRERIESGLNIKAYDIYGLSEVLGPGVAIECTEQNGLHIWEDHFIVEVVDPKTMRPLPSGQPGQLVITTLTKQALPLIRYCTGDICCLIDEPCACGRTMRRISRIQGRLDDMLIIRGVNVYPSEIEAILFSLPELSAHYQILISREQALDKLHIRVERNEQPAADPLTNSALEQRLNGLIQDRLGLTASVEIVAQQTLQRSEGKSVRILDLRARE